MGWRMDTRGCSIVIEGVLDGVSEGIERVD